ncbi:MAG: hypothetical protein GF398_03900 [Chitinivibrionales bacterium]|nr:hypothetical protein [Chitinivibrionales bacterium]
MPHNEIDPANEPALRAQRVMRGIVLAGMMFWSLVPAEDALVIDPDVHAYPERGFGLRLPRAVRHNSLLFAIDHRVLTSFLDDPFHSYFGFDNGVKVSLGLRYGLFGILDFGIIRTADELDPFDTYEFDVRFIVLTEDRFYVDASVAAGVDWFVQQDRDDASGFFGIAMIGRSLLERLYLSTGMIAHSNSTYTGKFASDADHSVALPVIANVRITNTFSLTGEFLQPLAGFATEYPYYGFGVKIATYRHTFALLASTSKYIATDGIVAGGADPAKPAIAFSITRTWNF